MGRDLCYAGVVRPKIRPGAEVSLLPESARSVVVGVVRRVQVAGGVFAPGHLGELTQVVPFELVDAVLEETGTTERRLRSLPSRDALPEGMSEAHKKLVQQA